MGECDVVVTDGFVGNVVLKLSEGIALALVDRVRSQLAEDWLGLVGAPLFKRALRRLRDELDWENVGGAPLLGLDGIGLVAHGAATPRAIANAVRRAREYHDVGLVAALRTALEQGTFDEMTSTSELPLTRLTGSHRLDDE
jgi:glycerol-3-phosphate acyltransferase PlsX